MCLPYSIFNGVGMLVISLTVAPQAGAVQVAKAGISWTQAEWPRAIEELTSFPHIEEAAVLSTCNRMELYVVALSWHRVSVSPVHRLSGVPQTFIR